MSKLENDFCMSYNVHNVDLDYVLCLIVHEPGYFPSFIVLVCVDMILGISPTLLRGGPRTGRQKERKGLVGSRDIFSVDHFYIHMSSTVEFCLLDLSRIKITVV